MRICLLMLWLLGATVVNAKDSTAYAFWVEFKTKDTSGQLLSKPELLFTQKAVDRRYKHKIAFDEYDLPVSINYMQQVKERGFDIITHSRWLNAVTIKSSHMAVADSLKGLAFISRIIYLGQMHQEQHQEEKRDLSEMISILESKFDDLKQRVKDTSYYGKSSVQNRMLKTEWLHQKGYDGTGIDIAVIDAGFKNAQASPFFKHLFDSSRILGTYDFVSGNENVFDDDDHGLSVFSCMGAKKPYEYVGTAPQANYWLLRTEQSQTEQLLEEALWVEAIEFADSVGVDIVNSSLGYNLFDDHSMNHKLKELNGKTAIISRAASIAASRGVLLVNSAGNEGDNKWQRIGFPADAKGILTVGSVDQKGLHSMFSSIGPSADKRIKPDVVAMGENTYVVSGSGNVHQSNGTSYASPIMAGLAACLLQSNYEALPDQVIQALQLSSHQYYAPDKFEGFGIPDAALADTMLKCMTTFNMAEKCLDARWLKDDQAHLTLYIKQPQKMQISITDEVGAVVLQTTQKINTTGMVRLPIRKSNKLPPGIYEIKVVITPNAFSFRANKPQLKP